MSETHITQLNDAYEFYGFAWEEKGPQSLVILDAVYTETEQEEPSRELSSTTGKTWGSRRWHTDGVDGDYLSASGRFYFLWIIIDENAMQGIHKYED